MSTIEQRRDQMFPKLGPEEIARLERFGDVRRYKAGDLETGKPSPGMFVLTAWAVAVCARDGLGHVAQIVEHEPPSSLPRLDICRADPRWSMRARPQTSRRFTLRRSVYAA
jgi:hypothetical protein